VPEHQILRLHIDGRWTAAEMAAEFSALDYLYNIASIIDPLLSLPGGSDAPFASEISSRRSPYRQFVLEYLTNENLHPMLLLAIHERCTIRRLEFASPGVQDFLGSALARSSGASR